MSGVNERMRGSLFIALSENREKEAKGIVEDLLDSGMSPADIITDIIKPVMELLSKYFDEGKVYLPTIVAASNILDELSKDLTPKKVDKPVVAVMGTATSDVHEIGKNICVSMARSRGYNVVDLGCDVPNEKFISAAVKNKSDVIAVSSTMKSSLKYQEELAILASEKDIPVLIGGASCSEEWCEQIGAAGYSKNCLEFTELLKRLANEKDSS